MNQSRRAFLKSAGFIGAIFAATATGLLRSGDVLAAVWNKVGFTSTNLDDAMKNTNYSGGVESGDILLNVPDIAENGAVVPVEVTSNIPGTTAIAIFVENNQNPLIADFEFSNGAEPYISTRIKMNKTSQVKVAVRAGDKVFTLSKEVKVTIGGCGG